MRKEAGWQWYHSTGLALSWSRGNFHTNWCRPHTVRGLKLLHEPCFYYLQAIIVFQYRQCRAATHFSHHTLNWNNGFVGTSSPIFEKTVSSALHNKSFQITLTIHATSGVSEKVLHRYWQHCCSYFSVISMIGDLPIKIRQTNKKTLMLVLQW